MKNACCCFCLLLAALACSDGIEGEFTATGIIEGTAVKVSAQTSGQLLDVRVEEGQHVKAGEVLAVVDTVKLVLQKEQVTAALEEVQVQLEINRNILRKAQSDFEYIEKKYKRFQELYQNKATTGQVLEDVERAYDAGKTQLDNARRNMQLVESRRKSIAAQLRLLDVQLNDATVMAPISGVVTSKYFERGETVAPGLALVELVDLGTMWTKVYVSEKMLPKIGLGDQATLLIDGTTETLDGRISWISPEAEFTPKNILTEESRTALVYAVKVIAENEEGLLKQGMPVEVRLKMNHM